MVTRQKQKILSNYVIQLLEIQVFFVIESYIFLCILEQD